MTGWMTMVVWTVGIVSSLTFLATLTRWTLDYRERQSQSRAQQTQLQMEMMAQVVTAQTALTELVLVGRPVEPTSLPPEIENPTVTLPSSDELFRDLPENIRDAMLRETEEQSTWPSQWEKPPTESGIMEEMAEVLRSASPTRSNGSWAPQPEGSSSG